MTKMYFKGGKGIENPVDFKGEPIEEGDILTHSYFYDGVDRFFAVHYPKLSPQEIEAIKMKPTYTVKKNKDGIYFGEGIDKELYLHDFHFKECIKL